MNKEPAVHEIRKLEQDLENLERSYTALEKGTWWAKQAFFVYIAALVAIVVWCVVNDHLGFAAMLLILTVSQAWYYTRGRWIDTLSFPGSDAVEIEAQIAKVKARLAILSGG